MYLNNNQVELTDKKKAREAVIKPPHEPYFIIADY